MSNLVENTSGSKYSDEDRMRAAIEYSVHGSLSKVEEYTGIPKTTVHGWTKLEWWHNQLEQLRKENQDIMRAKYSKIIQDGLDVISDRLENGDAYVSKEGDIARKPVSLRDASTATGIAFDKLRLIDGQATTIKGTDDKALIALKEQFEKIANTRTIDGEVISKSPVESES